MGNPNHYCIGEGCWECEKLKKQDGSAVALSAGLGIDKRKLREKITEIVGVRVYSMREIMSGKYPGEYDTSKWREEYRGKQNLPPYVIELNHFKTEVDEFTAMIMQAVADA